MIGTRGIPARYGGFETAAEQVGTRLVRRGHDVVVVREEHSPFSYEFARPVGAEVAADRSRRASADPFTQGHAAAL